ncbi:hypothetical protein NBRC111894_449 [Sporolactobacillus inulinus]|uniref:Uncharacterized protein n=1 Tax=Sporolactobacillus inulinus TaxID=2078 RepID=A0A4Y1Z798_9BACL|nr:hypothetical protein NBRC111894_449 [Sporolactobacillus inulinus]
MVYAANGRHDTVLKRRRSLLGKMVSPMPSFRYGQRTGNMLGLMG